MEILQQPTLQEELAVLKEELETTKNLRAVKKEFKLENAKELGYMHVSIRYGTNFKLKSMCPSDIVRAVKVLLPEIKKVTKLIQKSKLMGNSEGIASLEDSLKGTLDTLTSTGDATKTVDKMTGILKLLEENLPTAYNTILDNVGLITSGLTREDIENTSVLELADIVEAWTALNGSLLKLIPKSSDTTSKADILLKKTIAKEKLITQSQLDSYAKDSRVEDMQEQN